MTDIPRTPSETAAPQAGTWTLTAPDGRSWTGKSPLDVVRQEICERVPPEVQLRRILDGANAWSESAIWLRSEGNNITVLVERDGRWIPVISSYAGPGIVPISHIVEIAGIERLVREDGAQAQSVTLGKLILETARGSQKERTLTPEEAAELRTHIAKSLETTVSASVYESAVKGRSEFRQAYRDARTLLQKFVAAWEGQPGHENMDRLCNLARNYGAEPSADCPTGDWPHRFATVTTERMTKGRCIYCGRFESDPDCGIAADPVI